MTSQGQRFRRRALRRGYKVDEVDAFLDRVEATLAGEQVGPPVAAQEVHDVVFRVRFGGYDEWQVDLHLDRVERQLAEFEERGGRPAPDPMRDSMRSGLTAASASGPPSGGPGPGGPGQGFDRGGFDRGPGGPGGMPQGQGFPPPGQGFPPGGGMQPQGMPGQGGFGGPQQQPGPAMNPAARMASPPTERLPAPVRDDRMMPPQMPQRQQQQLPPGPDPYGRYDEPTGYGQQQPPQQQPPQRPGPPPGYDQGGYDQGGYDGFEPGRHGKADMTAEIRMPDRDPRGGYGQMPGAPMPGSPMAMPGSPMPGAPMSGPPYGGGYGPQQPQLGPPLGEPGGELYRVDQLRRTFQPRRFGSGYDPMQVDRLFEGILQAMTGRGPMPVNENDLDMLQFGLVPNGYFEAEVDAALREVKDILLRRR
ncbi:DivIVA domain-containing protein [Actinoplanes flavus]|uniref:DivIVA domain-containing protein n=1 Tax=Actinoplanes flavus TaxID=2820290 RepID=A0ABS3UEJ8_9ACTN|nr:DivIVA domain-containing protein [Actinoplanes flavus]MBO3736188.1 DivIVA domain-containing protein [Actinoplanes flavus]